MIPVYNERDNLALLHSELAGVMGSVGDACEILFVDDGSTDGSDRVLRDLRASDPRVRVLTLAKNSGQSAAMDAGFKSAAGEVVV
ncbi:MAG: glycosyltransferase, partial [Acidobacteriota bacterium]